MFLSVITREDDTIAKRTNSKKKDGKMDRFKPLYLLIFTLLVACGPSPEEIATMTAEAWTPTPLPTNTPTSTPTSTPTPIPYDVELQIQDKDGASIAAAQVQFMGTDGSQQEVKTTDDSGSIRWNDFPQDSIDLQVISQGYFPIEATYSIERGLNDIVVEMERDPNGLLPKEACGEGEVALYIEDFQDGQAQGWPEIALGSAGWQFEEEDNGDIVLLAQEIASSTNFEKTDFMNVVWRFSFKYSGMANPNYNFLSGGHGPGFQVGIISIPGNSGVQRTANGTSIRIQDFRTPRVQNDVWYFVEISSYNNILNVFLNGEAQINPYSDPDPWGSGGISIEPWMNAGSTVYFDDFSVCGLQDDFVTMYASEGSD
jgi:hypothetical protein